MYFFARRLYREEGSTDPTSDSQTLLKPQALSAAHILPLLSALLAAIYLFFAIFAASLMTETFYITALLWSLERGLALQQTLRSTYASRRQVWLIGLGLGIALGIATLLRQSILPWAPIMGLWLLWRGWRHQRLSAAFQAMTVAAVVVIACILPFTLRNYRVYNEFLLLNSNAGYAMYSAQHPMHGASFREYDAAPVPEGLGPSTRRNSTKYSWRVGSGSFSKTRGAMPCCRSAASATISSSGQPPTRRSISNLGRVLSIALFLPFMLYGIWLAARNRYRSPAHALLHREDVAFLLLFMAFYSLLHILTWAMAR